MLVHRGQSCAYVATVSLEKVEQGGEGEAECRICPHPDLGPLSSRMNFLERKPIETGEVSITADYDGVAQ
jgi:hypothetical protein